MKSRLHRVLTEPLTIHRRGAHIVFATVVWPVLTIWCTAYALVRMPYYRVAWRDAVLAGAGGVLLRLPDLLVTGLIFFGLSGFIFSRFGKAADTGRSSAVRLFFEPLIMFLAATFGIALWYPAVLSDPLFLFIDFLPVSVLLLMLLAAVLVGAAAVGRPGKKTKLAGVLVLVGMMCPVPLWVRTMLERPFGHPPSLLLLGVDSISHLDDIGPLERWVKGSGGTWYERAVTPALFTNPVWTSILTMSPVREHTIYHTFQRMTPESAALLHAARAKGYRTIAGFSDQLTAAPGPTAGFDENRSGPMGWRQLLMPMVANGTMLVPVIGAALPRPWPYASPSNETGTFTYSVSREIRRWLRSGEEGTETLVAAHLTYVHLPAFPSTFELSLHEIQSVLKAPAGKVRDRTIDWQDADAVDDPVQLNHWKLHRLQEVLRREVERSGFLAQGGRLVMFSDHGKRRALMEESFGDPRYHHVLLATFGLPAQCPAEPVSLIDIGRLMGLSDKRSEPLVEFAFAGPEHWPALVATAKLRWSGAVDLDKPLLDEVFAKLQGHRAWPDVPLTSGCLSQ